MDWDYKTKDSLPGDIKLTNEEGNEYTVSREEPTTAFESLGVPLDLANTSPDAFNVVTRKYHEFAAQMKTAKCNKTSYLNAFNTLFMPTLSYCMMATQFTEK